MNLLLAHIGIIIVSLALLAKSSSLTMQGVSNYARKLGLSDYLIGLFIVSLTASVPEFLASLSGIAFESSDVVFATIFGSNILGLTLVLGLLAIVGKKLPVDEHIFDKTKWDILLLVLLPFILMLDQALTFIDGLILIFAFIFYSIMLWSREGEAGTLKHNVKFKSIFKDGLLFVLALLVVLASSIFIVNSSLHISSMLSLSPMLVSILIIGIGSQVPDLFLSLQAVKKKSEGIALGELVGSMITKSLLFLGIFAMITPMYLSLFQMIIFAAFTFITSFLVFRFTKKGYLHSWQGAVLMIIFVVFMALQFVMN